MKPSDLNGKNFGIRSYTQTTGIWVRGILGESFGVDWSKVEITTMEDPHVAQYKDPSFVKRAPETKQLPQMLLDGELDAALIGDKFPDPRFKTLVPDAEAANKEWAEEHGGVPINHMVIVREKIAKERPDVVRSFSACSRRRATWTRARRRASSTLTGSASRPTARRWSGSSTIR